jgi:hypothetical protein
MTPGVDLEADLSGLGLRLHDLPEVVGREVRARWAAFLRRSDDPEPLDIETTESDRAMTPGRAMVGITTAEALEAGLRFVRDEGDLTLDAAARRATLRLARGDDSRRAWAVMNLAIAAIAWRLVGRGGGALHAAAILVDGRAFVLVGAEGTGKTTFAAGAAQAGLPVLSDDIVLVDRGRGVLEALGAPVRDRAFPHPGPGRWPVAAILLPRHGAPAQIAPATRLAASAAVAANLLYVSETWGTDERAGAAVEAILGAAPACVLTFPPGSSFVPLLGSFAG